MFAESKSNEICFTKHLKNIKKRFIIRNSKKTLSSSEFFATIEQFLVRISFVNLSIFMALQHGAYSEVLVAVNKCKKIINRNDSRARRKI